MSWKKLKKYLSLDVQSKIDYSSSSSSEGGESVCFLLFFTK